MSQEKNATETTVNDVRDLEPLLKKKFGNTFKVLNYVTDKLVPFGENFGSSLLKIHAKVQKNDDSEIEDLHLVAKKIIVEEEICNWTAVMKKEIFMYTDIIPLYVKLESENNVDQKVSIKNILPEFYGHRMSLDPNKTEADEDTVILLENLKIPGFYGLEKRAGLDTEHAIEALKALAQLHAYGIAARLKHPDVFESVKVACELSAYGHHVNVYYPNLIKFIKSTPAFAKYADYVVRAIEGREKDDNTYDAVRHPDWSTVAHYDFWTNNAMFRREAGKIVQVKIVDFQAYIHADLFVDLFYFLGTSLTDEAKFQHIDRLIDAYYDAFVVNLQRLGVYGAAYTREKFNGRMKETAWFEIFHCIFALSFFTCDADEDDREDLMQKITTFQGGELFQKKTAELLELYEKMGWLD